MRTLAAILVLTLAACARSGTDRPAAATTGSDTLANLPTTAVGDAWPDDLGAFLAIERAGSADALLFRRDTTQSPSTIAVVGFDSLASAVTLRDVRNQPCAARALLRVTGAPAGWSVALDAATAHPLLIDAVEDLPHADSQRVVIRVQRALNALPDTGSAVEFHALPVVVRDAWIVHTPQGPLTVARAARLRNVEAASHEELRFAVLEENTPRFVARTAGEEESVESWDLLAAVQTARGPVLAIAREGAKSLQLELVRRDSVSWRSIWRSDALTCPAQP